MPEYGNFGSNEIGPEGVGGGGSEKRRAASSSTPHLPEEKEPKNTNYHAGFVSGLRLLLWDYRDRVDILPELWLSTEGLRMDVLVLKKDPAVEIDSDICRIFRGHNIIEYKRMDDALDMDVFSKLMAYAHLYKSQGKTVDAIPYGDISATVYRYAFPRKTFRALEELGAGVVERYPGVYYVSGVAPFRVQVLVGRRLGTREYAMFKVLRAGASDEEIRSFKDIGIRVRDAAYQASVDAIYQVSVTKNRETYFRLRREDAAMCEALRELFADEVEQAEREGKRQGKIEGKIEEAILIYQDELSLSPEQTVQKIMTRFGLERKDAEQSVEKVLNSGAVGVSV